MIVIVFGLPGSGKSYFASRLANIINAEYISSDKVRLEIHQKSTYSEKEKLSVYNEMLKRTKKILKEGRHVVLDATFYMNDIRRKFIDEVKGDIIFIEIIADEPVIKERLKGKRINSDADFEVYKKIKNEWESLSEYHLILQSTYDNIEEMLHKAASYLQLRNDKRTNK